MKTDRTKSILRTYICLFLAIILFWPFFLTAQESVTLNPPSPGCLGSEAFVNLNWTSTISGNPTFFVLRKIQGELDFTEITSTQNTYYQDKPIDSDKIYIYQIKAKKGAAEYFSNQVPSPAQYCPPTLSPPVSSCRDDGPHIVLNWSSVSGNLSTYEIYRDGLKLSQTANTTFDDGPNIEGTKTYNYFIKAIWQDGNSTSSDVIPVTALACPSTLTATADCNSVSPGGPKVNLSWNSLLGIQNYQIYRKAPTEADFCLFKTLTETNYQDNLVESLPTYSQAGQISYYVKAIWLTNQKDSSTQRISIPRCPPYLTVESVCNTSGLLNPEMRLSWIATQGAIHYNIYRNGEFRYQTTATNYIDYLDPTIDCPGKICTHTYTVDAIVTGFPAFSSNQVSKSIDCSTVQPPWPAPVLSEPSLFCVSGDSRVSLSWTASDNVVYYTLYRNEVGIINLLETSYTDSGVESGYTYTYRVTAFGKGGTFTNSENNKTIVALDCTQPSTPVLSLSRGCETGKPYVSLSWTATTNTLKYEIYRGTLPTALNLLITFEKGSPEFVSRVWKDTSVSGSTAYYYQVVAVGSTGVPSSPSTIPSITTYSCLPTTPTLTLTTVCESGSAVVNLSWTAADVNTTHHYEIFREDYSLTTPIRYEYDLSKTNWKDTSVSQETTYKYKVEAVGYGESPPRASSGYKSITTYNCSPLGPFTLSEPTVYCQGSYPRADLSWTASTNATSYDLLRNQIDPAGPTVTLPNVSSPYIDRGLANALSFDGSNDYVRLSGLSVNTSAGATNTVEFWMYWKGGDGVMPFGWQQPYDLWFSGGCFGFNTGESNVYGISSSGLANRWVHVVAVFYNGVPSSTNNALYINGAKQSIYSCRGSTTVSRSVTSIAQISGWAYGSGYYFGGTIDEVRIYNRALSDTEASDHYQGIFPITETGLVGLWHFDEGTGQYTSDSSNYGNNPYLGSGTGSDSYDPTWIQNGLQFQAKYNWQAKANGPGGSTFSNTTNPNVMPLCPPTKPGLVLSTFCEAGTGRVTLRWSYSINTTKYEIYRQDKGLIGTTTQSTDSSLRTLTDNNDGTGLAATTSYTYYIKAIGPTGLTNQSDSISITTPDCTKPTKPQNLTANFACGGTGNSYPRVNLSWSDSQYTSSYSIYRNGGFVTSLADTDSPTYTYSDAYPGVQVNTTYSYFITAVGPGGSTTSDAVSTTTGYCSPSTPSITVLSTGCESLAPFNTISWSDATTFNTNSYKIYRNTSNSPPASPIITIASTTPEFTSRIWKDNTSFIFPNTYYYWMKAVGPAGESSFSASKSIAIYSCGITPGDPTLIGSIACVDNVPRPTLSWDSVSNAYSYNLYRTNPDASQSIYSTRLSPLTDRGGFALKFDGVNDYATAGPSSSLNDAALNYTVTVWFKASQQNEYWKGIIGKPGRNYNIWLGNANGGSPFIHHRFRTNYSSNDGCLDLSGIIWNDWNFVAITNDGVTCRTYIFNKNGNYQTSRTFSPYYLISDNTALQIGRSLDGSNSNFFNGLIDEIRVYARALTAEEITNQYQGIIEKEAGIKGAWHFDEGEGATLFDNSGNGNNGKIDGPAWATGKIARGLEFGGLNGYINVPDSASLRITNAITVEAWVKSTKNNASLQQGIIAKANLGGSEYGWILRKHTDNKFYFSTGPGYPRGDYSTYSNIAYTDNSWHHIVGVHQADGINYIYIDGVRQNAYRTSSSIIESNQPVTIATAYGDYPVYPSYHERFGGSIDEVRIYNRALSSAEIAEHFNGTFTNESGLVGLWHFDEGSGNTAYDDSPFENNGTLIKGAEWTVPSDAPATIYNKAIERDKSYKYYVKAFGADTESSSSTEISFTAPSCLPAKPNLVVTPQCDGTNSQLKLIWPADSNTLYWTIYKGRGEESPTFLLDTTLTSYTDDNIESGINYTYFVIARGNEVDEISDTLTESAPFCYLPPYGGSPFPISATSTCYGYSPRILIQWQKDLTGNTISYNVWRKNITLGETEFTKIYSDLPATAIQYIDIVAENNNYVYKIEAVGSGVGNTIFSDPSNTVTSYECSKIPPFPPTLYLNLIYSVDHVVAVSIGWSDAGNEEEYKVFRSGSGFILIATTSADVLNHTDYTVTDGQTYEYQVMASNINGDTLSNIISVSVPIARPGDFTLSGSWIAGTRIRLSWTEALTTVAGGTVYYDVLRDSSKTFESPTTIISATTSLECYDDTPSFLGRFYKTIAKNSGGQTESNIWESLLLPQWKEIAPF